MGAPKRKRRPGYFAYWAVRSFSDLVSHFPLPVALAFGRTVGWGVRVADRRHRIVARENLDACFGDGIPPEEKERIIRKAYENLGLILAELIQAPSVIRRETWRRWIEVDGEEHAAAAAKDGKGIIFISGHTGNWELLGIGMTLLGYPLHTIARPLDNPHLDRYLLRARTRYGQKIIPQEGSFPTLVRLLRTGGHVGLLVDQNQKEGGIFVDFFGRKASTMRTAAILQRRSGAPIVTGYIRREPGAFRHRIRIDPPIFHERTGSAEEDIRRITQLFTSRIESYVRESPGQWLWHHRRWRTRPPEERKTEESEAIRGPVGRGRIESGPYRPVADIRHAP